MVIIMVVKMVILYLLSIVVTVIILKGKILSLTRSYMWPSDGKCAIGFYRRLVDVTRFIMNRS